MKDLNFSTLHLNVLEGEYSQDNFKVLSKMDLKSMLDDENKLISRNLLIENMQFEIPVNDYKKIKAKASELKRKYTNKCKEKLFPINRLIFANKKVKSCKFRMFMNKTKYTIKKCVPSKTRAKWAEKVFNPEREKSFFKTWNLSFIPVSIRESFFKFLNNKLFLNANIAHFDEQVDPTCTFCKALRNFPAEKETYRHLFYTCTATSNISVSYFNKFFQGTRYNWEPNFILLGANNNLPEAIQLVINVEIATFIHFILEHRKNNKIPLLRNLEAQTSGLREIYMKSKVYQKAYNCFRQ